METAPGNNANNAAENEISPEQVLESYQNLGKVTSGAVELADSKPAEKVLSEYVEAGKHYDPYYHGERDLASRANKIKKGTPEYKRLAYNSIDRNVRKDIESARSVADLLALGGEDTMQKALDEVVDKIAYSGWETGHFYDIHKDQENGEILMGRAAEAARRDERTRYRASLEQSERYYAEKDKLPRTVSDYLGETINMAETILGYDDPRVEDFRDRVNQNIADTYYDHEVEFYPPEGGRHIDPNDVPEADNSGNEFWVKIDPTVAIEEVKPGKDAGLNRLYMREINIWGKPIKQTEEYKYNLEKMDPALVEWIGKTEKRIMDVAPSDFETYDLIYTIRENIAAGRFNGMHAENVRGDGDRPYVSPFVVKRD